MTPSDRHNLEEAVQRTRREFLTTTASGLGAMALGSMLSRDGLLTPATAAAAAPPKSPAFANPLAPKPPHFAPRAKRCIFIFMEGAPSQMDLFDPKPRLN